MGFQRSRLFKRVMSISLAMAMILSSNLVPGEQISYVHAEETAPASNQISAEPAKVYINNYTGNDRVYDFNENWKFDLGDTSEDPKNAGFDDGAWKDINLPHDFSIEQSFTGTGAEAESGFLPGGTGWYRKTFKLDSGWTNKRISINFDGVYMDSYIYLNGQKLGEHHYGYTPFSFELPANDLIFDGDNIIAVKVVNNVPSSRWYSGSGIYRDVTLVVTDKVHVSKNGVTVLTPNIGKDVVDKGKVVVKVNISNDSGAEASNLSVRTTVHKKDDVADLSFVSNSQEITLSNGANQNVETQVIVDNPALWEVWDQLPVDNQGKRLQNLYIAKTELLKGGEVIDTVETTFGFRYLDWTNQKGFAINGRNIKLQGVCMHHDQGALGSEAWYDAIERQVDTLIDMGVNSIRVTHNPAAQALVDICDDKGVLLIDEAYDTWTQSKNGNGNDYGKWFNQTIAADNKIEGAITGTKWSKFDTEAMVSRGKNSPSIIMWSLGNELMEGGPGGNGYGAIATELIGYIKAIDTLNGENYKAGRWVTFGDNKLKSGNANSKAIADSIHAEGGIIGYNYATLAHMSDTSGNTGKAEWKIYGSETASSVNSRGAYKVSDSDKERSAYDTSCVGWGAVASDAWLRTIKWDRNAGEYVWTGFDYIGEPTPWNGISLGAGWGEDAPKSAYFGIIETTGFPKDSYYLYRSVWNHASNTLHILPSWDKEDLNLNAQNKTDVVVYTDAYQAELWLKPSDGSAARRIGDRQVMQDVTSVAGTDAPGGNVRNGIYKYKMQNGNDSAHANMYFKWNVTYEPGTLYARIYDKNGSEITDLSGYVGRKSVTTTDKRTQKLSMSVDKNVITADGKSLSYVTIDVTDAAGNLINSANNQITVSIDGPGTIVGVDNGMQKDHTSYQSRTRNAYHGKLLAIVQSTKESGNITVNAVTSDGKTNGASVSIKSEAEAESANVKKLTAVEYSKIHYLQKGTELTLPRSIKGYYNNGDTTWLNVEWNKEGFNNNLTNSVQTINGVARVEPSEENAESINIAAIITVLDPAEVVALLNYSTAVITGQSDINLPSGRPVVMNDGTVLDVYFNVEWDKSQVNLDKEGIYVVSGKAMLFGKELHPTATIRVQGEKLVDLGNVAPQAAKIYINEDDTNKKSELAYLVDDVIDRASASYSMDSGSIRMLYDTAISTNSVTLAMDNTIPTSDSVHISWSADSVNFMELPTRVENISNANGIIVRRYTFDMVPAIAIKAEFDMPVSLKEIGIQSVNLYHGVGVAAKLSNLVIKGRPIANVYLSKNAYATPETVIDEATELVAEGQDNASVTILPVYENSEDRVIKILLESEDNNRRGVFTINLGKSEASAMDPEDGSHDYPYNKTTASAPSYQNGEEASKAVDGDENSKWHTAWQTDLGNTPEQRYIQISMEEAQNVVALRCLMRVDGNKNGRITQYEVYGSNAEVAPEEKSAWERLSDGNWSNDGEGWKLASFRNGATAIKHIRLYGVATIADSGANKFVSAREIRVVLANEDIYDKAVAVIDTESDAEADVVDGIVTYPYTGNEIRPSVKVQLKEAVNEKTLLVEGEDYTVAYTNNVEVGNNAAIQIEGIGAYSGLLRKTFAISERVLEVESIEPTEITVTLNEVPRLPATVTVNITGGTQRILDVNWQAVPNEPYANKGVFYVTGTVNGSKLLAIAKITVTENITASSVRVEPISAVTLQGQVPVLPNSVKVHQGGNASTEAVDWNMSDLNFNLDDGSIVTVYGTVNGITDAAVANVRIVEAKNTESDYTNISYNSNSNANNLILPKAIASYYENNGRPEKANDGNWNIDEKVIWSDWQRSVYHDNVWLGIVLGSDTTPKMSVVNKAKVGFYDEKKAGTTNDVRITFPEEYYIEYYVGPNDYTYNNDTVDSYSSEHPFKNNANWVEVKYIGEKPDIPEYDAESWAVDLSFEPVFTSIMRIRFHTENKWTGLKEFEVYGYPVDYNTSAEASQITVDGNSINLSEFNEGVYLYKIDPDASDVPVVAATADNNASVSISQAASIGDEANIYVISENGKTTKQYTIRFVTEERIAIDEKPVWNSNPVRGGRFDIIAPTITGKGMVTGVGYKIKLADQQEYQPLDITTARVCQEHEGAEIVFYAVLAGGEEITSDSLEVHLGAFYPVDDIVVSVDGYSLQDINEQYVGKQLLFETSVTNSESSIKDVSLTIVGDTTDAIVYAWRTGKYILTPQKAGTILLQASVSGGMLDGKDFVKEYRINIVPEKESEDENYVSVTGVKLSKTQVQIGTTTELIPTILPADATSSLVKLSVKLEDVEALVPVALINGGISVTPNKIGKYSIVATVKDGIYKEGIFSDFVQEIKINVIDQKGNPEGFESVLDNPAASEEVMEEDRVEYATDYHYTGKAITPSVEVWDNGVKLTAGVDYSVSYKNNKNAWVEEREEEEYTGEYLPGVNNKNRPTIIITGKGSYTKKQSIFFNILPQDITKLVPDNGLVLIKSSKSNPVPVIYNNGTKLVVKKDYKVDYFADKAVVTGIGNYTGVIEYSIVNKNDLTDVSKLGITIDARNLKYEGKEVDLLELARLSISDKRTKLTEGEIKNAFDISYVGNGKAGKATIVISAKPESKYYGSVSKVFTIGGIDLGKIILKGVKLNGEEIFQGAGYPITLKNMGEENKKVLENALKVRYSEDSEIKLIEGRSGHYTTTYKNNNKVGTATVTLTGTGKDGVTGKATLSYKIVGPNADAIDAEIEETVEYAKGGAKPAIRIVYTNDNGDAVVLIKGVDYTVTYDKNKIKGIGKTAAEITYKGNYKNLVKDNLSYEVVEKDISKTHIVAIDLVDGKTVSKAPKVTVTDVDGKALKLNTDYELTFSTDGTKFGSFNKFTPNKNDEGSYRIKIIGKGCYDANTSQEIVLRVVDAGQAINSAKLTLPKKEYTGKAVLLTEEEVKALLKTGKNEAIAYVGRIVDGMAVAGIDETKKNQDGYYIVGYINNVNKGSMTVILRGNGKYYGSKTVKIGIGARDMQWLNR